MVPASRASRWLVVLGGLLLLAGCGSTPEVGGEPDLAGHYKLGKPYQIAGRWYYPAYDPSYVAEGIASWYGEAFHGLKTANGEVFDRYQISAAHPTLPLPSIVRVTNLANHRQLELRVNDRGPFVDDRVIDLSQAAARALGFERRGTTPVRVEFIRLADSNGTPPEPTVVQTASAPIAAASQPVRAAAAEPAAGPVVVYTADGAAPAAQGRRCPTGGFIQVGAFVEADRALRLARDLDAAVLVPVSAQLPSVDQYARVRLGPLPDSRQAAETLRWLHQTGHAGAYLVRQDDGSAASC